MISFKHLDPRFPPQVLICCFAFRWVCVALSAFSLYQVMFTTLQVNWLLTMVFIADSLLNFIFAALIVHPVYEAISAFVMAYIFQVSMSLKTAL